ncbi:flagellar biosynthesis protein FliQ [Liquorilactobacillus mali]|uniref:Flagellar biosynthetic protein FliQ n=2 Tax=Liquorilactobacillus mali TaxID=1618 RepID=J1F631_9LACO|nr:flagellar biosynthesis protein FliQ [Liquorilactobacillus mali]AJA34101.1 flagellar biosynthetic protein FliQ [Liquorilactobacillus mali KCTC 3596 = DSM 20444]EJF02208.1 flagellar biosynthesis protein FliQ [Liquorilactobacillus mali KCTC 3596 = DSM 20444]KRN11125.1 flagellar biosynthesis protein FliQ [Liquorilactobacillus mali KCTC 3596 = DSM 20444]KRN30737.1 flagellar biosynthesis protein FliQ [Liquorilactobacillus mali]MDC7953963.1 flagellar biosynthesis protein FliQ [Liquorilactobacillus
MTIEVVLQVIRDAFIRIILISGPAVGIGMLVGLIISIFQATTQIQEQTLSFVPKLVAILITLIFAGNFMMTILLEFTKNVFKIISKL